MRIETNILYIVCMLLMRENIVDYCFVSLSYWDAIKEITEKMKSWRQPYWEADMSHGILTQVMVRYEDYKIAHIASLSSLQKKIWRERLTENKDMLDTIFWMIEKAIREWEVSVEIPMTLIGNKSLELHELIREQWFPHIEYTKDTMYIERQKELKRITMNWY